MFSFRVKQPRTWAGRWWNAGQSVLTLVPVAFIVLKLTGNDTWSWWWVLSPVWISGVLLALALGALVVAILADVLRQAGVWDPPSEDEIRRPLAALADPDAAGR